MYMFSVVIIRSILTRNIIFCEIISVVSIHLGMNPIIGGSPARLAIIIVIIAGFSLAPTSFTVFVFECVSHFAIMVILAKYTTKNRARIFFL